MAESVVDSKTYIVDTSVVIGAPGCFTQLAPGNKVVVPHPVLKELDDKKSNSNGVGHSARSVLRLLDEVQQHTEIDDMPEGVPFAGGRLFFHGGEIDMTQAWPGLNIDYADDLILLFARQYRREHPAEKVVLLTRDGAMRCRARAQGLEAEDFQSDSARGELYTGRANVLLPEDSADLLAQLNQERRLSVSALRERGLDVPELFPNMCCELRAVGVDRSVWGIVRKEGGAEYFRKVPSIKESQGIGPRNMEQACALELIADPSVPIFSLMSVAGTGKTLIALLGAYKLLLAGKVSKIEVYRLNAEAGVQLGFLPGDVGEKMAPWTRPITDNMEFILSRFGSQTFPGTLEERAAKEKGGKSTLEHLLQSGKLSVSPINYLRGRSIHDAVIIVDDSQNLTQDDMKLVLTRAGEGSKVILTGDPSQTDRSEVSSTANGLVRVVVKFKGAPEFGHLIFNQVLRSRVAEMAATLL